MFGAVAIQGAHADLLKGLQNAAHDENAFTDLWVSPPGRLQPAADRTVRRHPAVTARAPAGRALGRRLPRRPAGLGRAQGVGARTARRSQPAAAVVADPRRLARAGERTLRAGGWVVLSQAIASEHHVHIGDSVTLPTPVPTSLRVAALSTNIGWAPGAVIMSASDYARHGAARTRAAYNVLLDPGVGASADRRRDQARARPVLWPVRAERAGARRRTERAQPPGPAAPHARSRR